MCGKFCIFDSSKYPQCGNIHAIKSLGFYILLYVILYIENIFGCGYICADLLKAKLAKISTVQNIPLLQYFFYEGNFVLGTKYCISGS